MIIDAILTVLATLLNVFLLPLEVVNISIDVVSSIPVLVSFLQVIAYLLPWSNLVPLFLIVGGIALLKIGISLVRIVLRFLPFM